jgi:hypothetical protein
VVVMSPRRIARLTLCSALSGSTLALWELLDQGDPRVGCSDRGKRQEAESQFDARKTAIANGRRTPKPRLPKPKSTKRVKTGHGLTGTLSSEHRDDPAKEGLGHIVAKRRSRPRRAQASPRAQQSRLNDNLVGPPPGAAYLEPWERRTNQSQSHPWSDDNVHLA